MHIKTILMTGLLLGGSLWGTYAQTPLEPLSKRLSKLDASGLAALAAGQTLARMPDSENDLWYATQSLADFGPSKIDRAGFRMESAVLVQGMPYHSDEKLALFNALSAIHTLSGVTYFSETRQKITILYDNVFRTNKPGSTKELPYEAASLLPESMSTTVHLKDSNFGSVWYTMDILTKSEGLAVRLRNARSMGIFVLQAFAVDGMDIRLSIWPVREGLLVTAYCAAAPSGAAASMVDIPSAVDKRLRAVQGWAIARIKEAR